MAAIRHKLRTRSSSGAPLAFSARAGVVLLKTFASIRPLRIYHHWQGGVLSGQKIGFHAKPSSPSAHGDVFKVIFQTAIPTSVLGWHSFIAGERRPDQQHSGLPARQLERALCRSRSLHWRARLRHSERDPQRSLHLCWPGHYCVIGTEGHGESGGWTTQQNGDGRRRMATPVVPSQFAVWLMIAADRAKPLLPLDRACRILR
jgi:hypothetical protein